MAASSVRKLVSQGKIDTDPVDSLPLEQASEAHRRLEKGKVDGKLVLKV